MTEKKDINDIGRQDGPQSVKKEIAGAQRFVNGHAIPTLDSLTFSASDLEGMTFDPLRFIVPRYITEGVVLLAGRPKLGKSWLALGVALAVASGGEYFSEICEQGDVLGLFLEDNKRRLHNRITTILGSKAKDWPSRFRYATEWPRLKDGGINLISEWIRSVERPRLIIVDVLQRVRNLPTKETPMYAADYEALLTLHQLASAERLTIVVIHHQRKAAADDPLDTVSGTLGLTGAADSIMILESGAGGFGRVLRSRGRDAPEYNYAVTMDDRCRWQIAGPEGTSASPERIAIVGEIKKRGGKPVTADDVVELLKCDLGAARKMLQRLGDRGVLQKTKHGHYALAEGEGVPDEELPF